MRYAEPAMRDLSSHPLMILKAVLFVLLGAIAVVLLLWDSPSFRTAALLAIAVWAFARAYYFAFYVMERYIDPSFRFSGLISAVRFLLKHRRP
jgi:hypothetical protein